MSQEHDEAQTGDDGGMVGPGAPTPLTALEVSYCVRQCLRIGLIDFLGYCGLDEA